MWWMLLLANAFACELKVTRVNVCGDGPCTFSNGFRIINANALECDDHSFGGFSGAIASESAIASDSMLTIVTDHGDVVTLPAIPFNGAQVTIRWLEDDGGDVESIAVSPDRRTSYISLEGGSFGRPGILRFRNILDGRSTGHVTQLEDEVYACGWDRNQRFEALEALDAQFLMVIW